MGVASLFGFSKTANKCSFQDVKQFFIGLSPLENVLIQTEVVCVL